MVSIASASTSFTRLVSLLHSHSWRRWFQELPSPTFSHLLSTMVLSPLVLIELFPLRFRVHVHCWLLAPVVSILLPSYTLLSPAFNHALGALGFIFASLANFFHLLSTMVLAPLVCSNCFLRDLNVTCFRRGLGALGCNCFLGTPSCHQFSTMILAPLVSVWRPLYHWCPWF